MAGLLVSVRSADEARAALAGGASVIDVKEPDRGPLGRADAAVWRAVREAVPSDVPVSVALGELRDWIPPDRSGVLASGAVPALPEPSDFEGIAYRKLGLAGAGPSWIEDWARLRGDLGDHPRWVAVVYADWERAGSPRPVEVLEIALAATSCVGLLIDTWDKSRSSPLDASWAPLVRGARSGGRFVALAGGLDDAAIARLAPLGPDLFAVRGAACRLGDRGGAIDPDRVARLALAASGTGTGRPIAGNFRRLPR